MMFNLQKGDKVAFVAPSGQIGDAAKIAAGTEYVKKLGLEPIFAPHLTAQYRYMGGEDKIRAGDVNWAFENAQIKAVFCVRAAAGATRILPYIDYELVHANPKPLIGFCDNAALFAALWQKSGICSLNGFSLTYDFKNGQPDEMVLQDLTAWLSGQKPAFQSGRCLQQGEAEGILLPINLSVLLRLAGTPYFPDLRGKILVIEDVHERIHKIDLMLQQLKQQPHFDEVAGIVSGLFTDCSGDEEDGSMADCLADFLAGVKVPAVTDFVFGHVPARHVLPFGMKTHLNAQKRLLKFI